MVPEKRKAIKTVNTISWDRKWNVGNIVGDKHRYGKPMMKFESMNAVGP